MARPGRFSSGLGLAALLFAAARCTLLVDTGGLAGGAAPDSGPRDATSADVGARSDGSDGGAPDDARAPIASGADAADASDASATVCAPGRADCNAGHGANVDGCECATPACCPSGGCQTTHANGVGETYYDCEPAGTIDVVGAMAACAAFAGGDATKCTRGWSCTWGDEFVCFTPNGGKSCAAYCWVVSGSNAGAVIPCECPAVAVAGWW